MFTDTDLPDGRVNELLNITIGTAVGGGSTYEYSLIDSEGNSLDEYFADMGISLTNAGVLTGYPKISGSFKFTVRVRSTLVGDPNYVTYDSKEYTLVVNRAEYPTLNQTTNFSGIDYADVSIPLYFDNFPLPVVDGLAPEDTAESDAVLQYEILDNNGVVSITPENGTGRATLNILSAGTTRIRVTKPIDDSYNSTVYEFTLTVNKTDLWLSVNNQTLYYGVTELPAGIGNIYIKGLRGHGSDKLLIDGDMVTELAGLGIAQPSVDVPSQLQNATNYAGAQPGTYKLVINNIQPILGSEALYEDTLSKYNINYSHGLADIIREVIYDDDYVIYPIIDGVVDYDHPVPNKINGRWYPHNIAVRPSNTSRYNLISGDGGDTWAEELRYEGDTNRVISMLMRQSSTGLTTDDYQLYIRIDTTNPEAQIIYSTTYGGEPVFNTNVDKTKLGAVYLHPFTISMNGTDPQNNFTASGIKYLQYLVITDENKNYTDPEFDNDSAWVNAPKGQTINITDTAVCGYYLRAVDYAGNVSAPVWYNYSDPAARGGWFVMDNIDPVIAFTNIDDLFKLA